MFADPHDMVRFAVGLTLLLLHGSAATSTADRRGSAATADRHGSTAAPLIATEVGVRQHPTLLAELETLFWDVATPGHAKYRQYLRADELTRYLRAEPAALASVQRWLVGSQGCVECSAQHTEDALSCRCPAGLAAVPLPSAVPAVYVYQPSSAAWRSSAAAPRARLSGAFPQPNHGTPARQKASYGIPLHLKGTNAKNLQEVWGCGTFGVNKTELSMYYKLYCPTCSVDDVEYGTANHGKEGGDNFLEGTLDTTYITAFAPGVKTINTNTNTSMATEEGEGQGVATVVAMEAIARRKMGLPLVLSLSLGSLGYDSCDFLCSQYAKGGGPGGYKAAHAFIQSLRQVCLYASMEQMQRINTAYMTMGLRGTTVLGASGDGGSHWSFGKFPEKGEGAAIGKALNVIGCGRMSPLFPANSPYVVAVGGLTWGNDKPANVEAWSCVPGSEGGSGGGFSNVWPAKPFMKAAVDKYIAKTASIPGIASAASYNQSGRAYPDISAFMDGVPLCFNGRCDPSTCSVSETN